MKRLWIGFAGTLGILLILTRLPLGECVAFALTATACGALVWMVVDEYSSVRSLRRRERQADRAWRHLR